MIQIVLNDVLLKYVLLCMQMSLKNKIIVFSIEFFQHSTIHIFSQANKNKIKMYHFMSGVIQVMFCFLKFELSTFSRICNVAISKQLSNFRILYCSTCTILNIICDQKNIVKLLKNSAVCVLKSLLLLNITKYGHQSHPNQENIFISYCQ